MRYGLAPDGLTLSATNSDSTTEHEVEVTGLSAGVKYFYSVGTSSDTLTGGDGDHFVVTAPVSGTAKPTRIWVIGDSGTANANARAVRDAFLNFTGSRDPDLWIMLGDNAYGSGTDAEYQAAVFETYPQVLRRTVLWSALGNHDGPTADSTTESGPYYDIFSFPRNGEAGGVPSRTEAYYGSVPGSGVTEVDVGDHRAILHTGNSHVKEDYGGQGERGLVGVAAQAGGRS